MNPNKKYVCAHCKSVCDLYGLFIHMKAVHKGILCQYCLKLFKKVPELESHLRVEHKVIKRYYHSFHQFKEYAGSTNKYNFICSGCNKVIKSHEIERHSCHKKQVFDCPFCERNFNESSQLEMHVVNGWCSHMTTNRNPTINEISKLYKVLTGLNYQETQKEIVPLPKLKKRFSVTDRQLILKYNNR